MRYGFEELPEHGLLIWERVAPSRWRVVYERALGMIGDYGRLDVGDVTGDGHDDVLLETSMGSGACGPRRLIAYAGGGTREVYERDFCEGHAQIVNGALRVQRLIGPCPYKEASAHCGGGFRTTFLRWRGAKLVSVRSAVRCELERLDPTRNCEPLLQRNTP